MIAYVNAAPGERLGAGEHFRVTLRRRAGVVGALQLDQVFTNAVTQLYERLAGATRLAYPISNNPAAPGKATATFDLRTTATAVNATVGELALRITRLLDNGIQLAGAELAELEKIPLDRIGSQQRAADRAAAERRAVAAAGRGLFGDAWASLTGWLAQLRWIVLGALVLLALAFAYRIARRPA